MVEASFLLSLTVCFTRRIVDLRTGSVLVEIMEAVCSLDSADLQRLSVRIARMSDADSDAESEADDEI